MLEVAIDHPAVSWNKTDAMSLITIMLAEAGNVIERFSSRYP